MSGLLPTIGEINIVVILQTLLLILLLRFVLSNFTSGGSDGDSNSNTKKYKNMGAQGSKVKVRRHSVCFGLYGLPTKELGLFGRVEL